MARKGNSARDRRSVSQGTVLWLVVPVAIVVTAALMSGRLPQDAGELLFAAGRCSGDECGPDFVVGADAVVPEQAQAQAPVACGGLADGPAYVSTALPGPLTAPAAVVIDQATGEVLYDQNAHQIRAPASLTKIATALVTLDHADLDAYVDVQVDGAALASETDSTVMGLKPGQEMSVRDLLYGLLLPSGNDAALALADYIAGGTTAFADLMNQKAAELGLAETHFVNPHGLDDPGHYTSAYDIAMLGREMVAHPELAEIASTRVYWPSWDGPRIWNGNRLLGAYTGVNGAKTGYTDGAGQTIVATAERDGITLVVAVLGSTDVYGDAVQLLDWGFSGTSCSQGG
jgi:D-alanyl-D-alanine carboxypeptidase (penicillin-binding protein 5/6)